MLIGRLNLLGLLQVYQDNPHKLTLALKVVWLGGTDNRGYGFIS